MWQDNWQTRPDRSTKTVTFKDDETIQIITDEEQIPVENNVRALEQIDHHLISDKIARSVSQLRDVQCYQEGVKIQQRKFTWEQFSQLDNQFRGVEDQDDD